MSNRVDSLRNTLDHLALDSRASEDRRYLVSMLRRLGYTDAEIEAEVGPVASEGSERRVIEVEYEGPVATAATSTAALGSETTFQVAQPGDDGLTFRLSEDAAASGAGVEEVHAADLSGVESDLGDWGDDFEQGDRDDFTNVDAEPGEAPDDFGPAGDNDDAFTFTPVDDEDEDLVEFRAVERPDPALAAGWQEAGDAEASGWSEAPESAWQPQEEESDSSSWDTASDDDAWGEAPADDAWNTAPETEAWPEPEAEPETEAWPETPPEEPSAWPEPEAEPETEAWPEPEAVPEHDVWEDADAPAADAWGEETHPEPAAAPAAPADASQAYVHGDYTLYTREVQLSTGRQQRIYFFAKNVPQSGDACPLPEGYEVIENDKTGLPFLRRQH